MTGTTQDQTTTYTRNPVQEIVGQSWTNDLYQWTGYANGTQSYTANGLNQYTTAAGATLTHDARGNLTGDGVWTYAFDADNKLKSATKTGYTATLAYDAEGRLRRTTLAGAITDQAMQLQEACVRQHNLNRTRKRICPATLKLSFD